MTGAKAQNPGVQVRPARAEDRAFVLATAARLGEFSPPPWRTVAEIVEGESRTLRGFFEGSGEDSAMFVAEEAQRGPLGFLYLETVRDYFTGDDHAHVGILAVAREGEGQGVAGQLLSAAEGWARGRGHHRLTLNVFHGNRHAREVYAHLGFAPETLRYVKEL